jgi:hypothetical protein
MNSMTTNYGTWKEELTLDGVSYRAEKLDIASVNAPHLCTLYAVDGLPARYERDLITAAQVCDVPHTWRVQQVSSPDFVTDEIVERGRSALRRDSELLNAHILTYIGTTTSDNQLHFIAAGALRNKLTRTYQNDAFPVVSRAIVAPQYRGYGFGNLIVEHRVKAVFSYYEHKPLAIHFGTDSPKILRAVKKVSDELGVVFVYIGDEEYTAADGIHTVNDYLCFLPHYQQTLLAACDDLETQETKAKVAQLKQGLASFMTAGVHGIKGEVLAVRYKDVKDAIVQRGDASRYHHALETLDELFFVKEIIGARDPR